MLQIGRLHFIFPLRGWIKAKHSRFFNFKPTTCQVYGLGQSLEFHVLFLVLFSGTKIPVMMYLVKADLTELTSLSFLKWYLYCPPRTAPAHDLFLWLFILSLLFWFLLASLSYKC